jgi:hypothetical protein
VVGRVNPATLDGENDTAMASKRRFGIGDFGRSKAIRRWAIWAVGGGHEFPWVEVRYHTQNATVAVAVCCWLLGEKSLTNS